MRLPLQTYACKGVPEDKDLLSMFAQLGFVGGPSTLPVLRLAFKCAQVSDTPVLIEGETGTGKGILTQAIHRLDAKRSSFQFVTVHCGTISDSLVESELFGHRRGSFSGAIAEREGLFQAASGGTLFIDDVNDLPLRLQPKLLDVLQRGRIRALGEDREKPIDVRAIAACNRPLEPLVAQGLFRSDLFYRLNVIKIQLPALRQRQEDLQALVLAFARRFHHLYGPIDGIAPAAKCSVGRILSRQFAGTRELGPKDAVWQDVGYSFDSARLEGARRRFGDGIRHRLVARRRQLYLARHGKRTPLL